MLTALNPTCQFGLNGHLLGVVKLKHLCFISSPSPFLPNTKIVLFLSSLVIERLVNPEFLIAFGFSALTLSNWLMYREFASLHNLYEVNIMICSPAAVCQALK